MQSSHLFSLPPLSVPACHVGSVHAPMWGERGKTRGVFNSVQSDRTMKWLSSKVRGLWWCVCGCVVVVDVWVRTFFCSCFCFCSFFVQHSVGSITHRGVSGALRPRGRFCTSSTFTFCDCCALLQGELSKVQQKNSPLPPPFFNSNISPKKLFVFF